MKTKLLSIFLLLTAVIFLWQAGPVTAALVAYEPFEYTAGDPLHGKTGGTFDGAWTDSQYWVPRYTASNGGLSYPGLSSSGNAALVVGDGSDHRFNRPIGQSWTTIQYTAGTDEVWISFLLRIDDDTTRADEYAGLMLTGLAAGHAFLGMSDTRNIGLTVMRHPYGTGTEDVGFDDDPVTAGETYLLLAHLVFNGLAADTIDLWVNPPLGGPLGDPNDSFSQAYVNLNRVDFRSAYMEGGALIDEIRVGDTLADVTPIPLPGAFLLLISGLVCLARVKNLR